MYHWERRDKKKEKRMPKSGKTLGDIYYNATNKRKENKRVDEKRNQKFDT